MYILINKIAALIPKPSPQINITKVNMVKTKSIIKIFKLKSSVDGSIIIGLKKIEYSNIGSPNAKQISKILLPKALEIASL